ncbi:MAG TPA: protein kinase, partial [Pirellulales bacterium]
MPIPHAAGPLNQGHPAMPKLDERAIFDAARQIESPEARSSYLRQACAGDRGLLERVEQLLRVHDEDETFLRSPAVPLPLLAAADGPGALIGPYKLVEQIGEGGFGMVYLAEQIRPVRRRVALKIVKPGMDTRQVIARFEAERLALAMMEHPNIARVFDGGATPAGRPFFVMELVKGVPITRYCDERQLSPHDRLQLFVAVCKAVQHAHQKGIIHRDLKPTNVLVAAYDGQPVPKIIDFGVAKALAQQLTERTLVTSFGGIIGTLEYMSPEQAEFNARDIDTRADVYSLGVILYELLTGVTPLAHERLKRTAIGEALRLIREEDPPKPSTRLSDARDSLASISAQRKLEPAALTQALRGELDWIAMKALDKDRDRRYQTANGLARDIERYLNDEPVEACPPSPAYRLRKFARKNRGLLSAIGAFALMLSVATAVSGLLAYRATLAERAMGEERDRAELEAARARGHEYVAHMNLAQAAWEGNRLAHLATLLQDHVPSPNEDDLRGFEWYYWQRLIDTPLVTFQGHQREVAAVAISSSGRLAASASHDGIAKIWQLENGRELQTLRGHKDVVASVALSPDDKQLATASFDGTVKIWDVATGNERATLRGHSAWVVSVAFSPDGRQLASASHDRTVRFWDATAGTQLRTIPAHSDIVMCVAFSPEGRRLASSSKDRTIKLWDVTSGEELSKLAGHTDEVACVAFSPDGRRLASASLDYTAKVWDTATGACLKTIAAHTERVFCVAFDPLGGRLATAGWDQTIRFWDASTFQSLGILKGHGQSIMGIAFSSDGRRLVSGSLDRTAKVWNSVAGQETDYVHHTASPWPMHGIAFSPDGSRLASGGQSHCVEVWDANSALKQMTLRGHSGEVVSVAFSPDGTRLASAARDNTARIWDASTGRALHALRPVNAHFPRVAFSPDGLLLATAGAENSVALWDVATGELTRSLTTGA